MELSERKGLNEKEGEMQLECGSKEITWVGECRR